MGRKVEEASRPAPQRRSRSRMGVGTASAGQERGGFEPRAAPVNRSSITDDFADQTPDAQKHIINRLTVAAINAKDWALAINMLNGSDWEHAGQPVGSDGPQPGNTVAHALAFQRVPYGTAVPDYPALVDRVVELVTEAGTLDHPNANGMTALAQACAQGNVDVAEALLNAGADPNIPIVKRNQLRYAKDFAFDGMCERRLRALFASKGARSAGDDVEGGREEGSKTGSFQQRQGWKGRVRNNPRVNSPFREKWSRQWSRRR